MKKVLSLLLVFLWVSVLAGCGSGETVDTSSLIHPETIPNPGEVTEVYQDTARMGEKTVSTAHIDRLVPMETTGATFAATVEITAYKNSYLGVGTVGYTEYTAEITQVHKGEAPEENTVTVFQNGTSRYTWSGNPLARAGDKFLIFAAEKREIKEGMPEGAGTFGAMQIVEYKGEEYIICRTYQEYMDGIKAVGYFTEQKVLKIWREADPVMEQAIASGVYRLDDVLAHLDRIWKE